jgi:AraC-like DNA-binding protein
MEPHIEIPPRLKPYVKQVWFIDGSADNSFLNFADGNPGIIFQQSESGIVAGGKTQKVPATYVFGQTIQPVVLDAPRNCPIIGIIFQPHVLKPVFRFDANEITDSCLDLKLLPAVPRINVNEQIWNMNSPEKQVQTLFKYLEFLIDKNKAEPNAGLEYATSRIMQLKGQVSLKQLQTELNLSERTFERKFEQHVGISPRLLSGIAQFQASLKQLRNNKYNKLSDIAYDNGYADQSHFIRSFKKFTGVTPLKFCKQLSENAQRLPYTINQASA